VGLSAGGVLALLDAFDAAGLELHSIMVARKGKVAVEGWWSPYAAARPHMLHSVTKAFTATGVGMAVHEGLVRLDDRVVSYFPERAVADGHLRAMRVRDLLAQTSGHGHGVSGSIWRGIATSWVDEFLKIAVPYEPGTHFQYSSATSFMLSAIVTRVSGLSLHDFLAPRLFAPLAMRSIRWDVGPEGINPGGNGISATTEDMLKLAVLHAADGRWEGRQILPPGWVAAASQPAEGRPYGFHWWVLPGTPGFFAFGAFGQYAFVFPEHELAIAITAAVPGSISRPDVGIPPLVWACLPRIVSGADESESTSEALAARLRSAALPITPNSSAAGCAADVSGARYRASANAHGIEAIGVDFCEGRCTLQITQNGRLHKIEAGRDGSLVESSTTLPGGDLHHGYEPPSLVTVAGAAWTAPRTLTIACQYVETAFRDCFDIEFGPGELVLSRTVNVNGAATSRHPIHARLIAG
jgi:CubicO group peptidase (beta-lactamase class C family)